MRMAVVMKVSEVRDTTETDTGSETGRREVRKNCGPYQKTRDASALTRNHDVQAERVF
jgi:hypothetical protein